MDAVRSYLLAIVAVSLLAVLAVTFLRHGTMQKMAAFASGLLLILTVVRPLLHLGDFHLEEYFTMQADGFSAQEAEERYHTALSAHVQSTTERYIRQKAETLGAVVRVEVQMSEAEIPAPERVCVIGTLDATQIAALSAYILEAFAIPEHQQEWKLYG